MLRTVEMDFEFTNTIEGPPASSDQMYQQACSSDQITIKSWKDVWGAQAKINHKKFGSFKDKSITKLFGKYAQKPVICAGSGPSLRVNGEQLKNRGDVALISCLHNYHFFEDRGIKPEFYVSLDAGPVTLEEVSEGGSKTTDEYWESTKDKVLLAYIGSHPDLFEKWQGEVYLFTCPIPDQQVMKEILDIEKFYAWVSTGGNVLGACVYIAKALFGANPIAFVGADFSFSYTKKFHGWDSKYDKTLGHCIRSIDVFGNKVLTWQSYYNFKTFFDWMSCNIAGLYVNCTEGGLLGSYPEGTIKQITQMSLEKFIRMYNLYKDLQEQSDDPSKESFKLLY